MVEISKSTFMNKEGKVRVSRNKTYHLTELEVINTGTKKAAIKNAAGKLKIDTSIMNVASTTAEAK